MRNQFLLAASCAALVAFAAIPASAQTATTGLWAGEVTLTKVNETVVGINAQNQVVAPVPTLATPVQSPAHLRILLHVDAAGQVRLLKNVAVLDKSTNSTPDLTLITDPALYRNFPGTGKRFSAVAFDFGDGHAAELLNLIAAAAGAGATSNSAAAAANAIVAKADVESGYQAFVRGAGFRNAALTAALSAKIGALALPTNATAPQLLTAATTAANGDFYIGTNRTYALARQAAALFPDPRYVAAVDALVAAAASGAATAAGGTNRADAVVGAAATNAVLVAVTNAINAPGLVSAGYQAFLATASFQSAAGLAATAATTAANQAVAGGALPALVRNRAEAAALKALTDGNVFKTADRVVNYEAPLDGTLAAGGAISGSLYLGANHPTNPFLHRRHTDHSTGYAITRDLSIQFEAANGTNALAMVGFGVDRIAGTYREEIFGLHKPLGPNQDTGLIAEGVISLHRVSQVSTLNQ